MTTTPPTNPAPRPWWHRIDPYTVGPVAVALAAAAVMAYHQNLGAMMAATAYAVGVLQHSQAVRTWQESARAQNDHMVRVLGEHSELQVAHRDLVETLRDAQQPPAPAPGADLCFVVEAGATCEACGQRAATDLVVYGHSTEDTHVAVARGRHCPACGTSALLEGTPAP